MLYVLMSNFQFGYCSSTQGLIHVGGGGGGEGEMDG